ncbi:DUF4446 family protein [Aneurinibacillus terranovensis]|uniref:DUF4446 family protein n=1 Tax=Aneurinibacillus terranovensis TaxID=278991 RepID=UPI0006872781
MEPWLSKEYIAGIGGLLLVLFLVLFIWNIVLSVKFNGLKKRFRRIAGGTSKENLEQILERLFDRMDKLTVSNDDTNSELARMRQSIKERKGHLGVVRFQAFQNEGSDLSFSIALLDDESNGVVLTSIFGRSESRMYAKPIQHGTSPYDLSEEEKEAIRAALKNGLKNE